MSSKKARGRQRANAKEGPGLNRYGEKTAHPFRNVSFSSAQKNRTQKRKALKVLSHESDKFDEHAENRIRKGSGMKNRQRKVITASRRPPP